MGLREPAMEDENELVADLVELGLTRNEARLYLAASGRPALRAGELAELAGVTRTKAYDGLHQLVEKGLLRQRPGRAARFEAAEAGAPPRRRALAVALRDRLPPRPGLPRRGGRAPGPRRGDPRRRARPGRPLRGRPAHQPAEPQPGRGGQRPGTSIVLEHQGLAATLTDAFDLAWARGTPVPG